MLWAAWARVAAGGGMAGADGVSVADFAQSLGPRLEALSRLLSTGGYRPQPLRLVPAMRSGRVRHRGVPTVADRVVQRAFLRVYGPRLEPGDCEVSFAYRRGRSWVDALSRARRHGAEGLRWVFRTDIADFFASIDHGRLCAKVESVAPDPGVADLVRGWIAAPVLTPAGLRERFLGLPEGAPISPTLANLFLRDLDVSVDHRHGRLVRYADDLALFCGDFDAAVAGAQDLLVRLTDLGLRPNEEKTYISTFDAGFRMLGWQFRGENGTPERDNPHWTHPMLAREPDAARSFG
jgi:group II intron reverse transcriptase/maturase